MKRCLKMQAGLTGGEIKFDVWDPSKGGNEESVTNDEHKKMNLASLEMSRSSNKIIKYLL